MEVAVILKCGTLIIANGSRWYDQRDPGAKGSTVPSIAPTATVFDAIALMAEKNIGALWWRMTN
jgi:CBS domain-containing protein